MEGSNIYELTLLISPDLSEFDVQKVVDKVKTSITSKGGAIQKEYTWGKKRLAYHIGKTEFGHYQTLIFEAPKETITEIDKDIRLMPELIRHLIISLEKEGVAIDQLFTPEKEATLIATLAKEKMEPVKPHQTRATRGRVTPVVETATAPEVKQDEEKTKEAIINIAEPVIEETADEAAKRREELDKKLDELLKE